ncbi:gamma-glutamylcyclotransferase family protein [Actomonas aquatica]|uniref:Gamma-glutamylcyclotransferase family protein n=1 Tax=Actomonas aquatica TaxID=2866162 RepID=A0ABZ1C5W2_9BACT|nr:gamma-glutamylcyclotransferase family protein [Opitutus sp. WL0086]WRQ86750.1 gamma-glutamylcyclotransferase family protein [Opitutus sp. WL0086]
MSGARLAAGPDEVAMFGFGSLLLRESIAKSLGRPYEGPLHEVELVGWTRRWNVSMPNRAFYAETTEGELWPEKILYLNIVRQAGARMNGVVMVVRRSDLASMDRRESVYDRVDVAADLAGLDVPSGTPVYAYSGQAAHCIKTYTTLAEMGLRQTYLDGVNRALAAMSQDYQTAFAASTEAVPQELVFADQLKAGEDPFGYDKVKRERKTGDG